MRKIVITLSLASLLVFLFAGCGEDGLFIPDDNTARSVEALRAPPISDASPDADDAMFCPFPIEDADSDLVRSQRAGSLAASTETPVSDRVQYQPRIEVDLEAHEYGERLLLKVSFYNPYRCHWGGHLFLERETEDGQVRTVGRRYNYLIRGGTRVTGHILVSQPPTGETHHFVARAYRPDGMDQRTYVNCLLSASNADSAECAEVLSNDEEPVRSADVVEEVWEEEALSDADADDLRDCINAYLPPINVGLRLRGHDRNVEMLSTWQNITRRMWFGDLYIDYSGRFEGVEIVRRDLGLRIPAGVGFCSWDRTRVPGFGVFRFAARALHRDGSAETRWHSPATTEIYGVCTHERCEFIEPDQERAEIVLTGRSSIYLESDFFSEFTRVILAPRDVDCGADSISADNTDCVFDITEYCEIRQRWSGGMNYIGVHFNTFDLPIGPRTWAQYTIVLHPMPVVPEGSKLRDSLWIFTNGGELTDADRG